jgi:hypothetical protein
MYQYSSMLASPMVMPAPQPSPQPPSYQPPTNNYGGAGMNQSSFASYLSPRRGSLQQDFKSRQDHYQDFMNSWMGQGSFDPYMGGGQMGYMSRPTPNFDASMYPTLGYVNPMQWRNQGFTNFRRVNAQPYRV